MYSGITRLLGLILLIMLPIGLLSQQPAMPSNGNLTGVIPPGSRIFIDSLIGGYDTYLSAAIFNKKVPLVIVTDRSKADFEMSGVTESDRAGWAKMLFLGSQASNEEASIKIVNLKTDAVVFGYNVHKTNSVRGKQSSAEACAKHLKEKIESQK